jgi:serralysin
LKGGPNSDTFLFDTALGAGNVDKITDLRGTDHIALDAGIFAALPVGVLRAKFFHAGTKAADGNDHIIYDQDTGKLFCDEDGKGGAHQILFAKVFDHGSHHPTLHAGDLIVI